RSVWLDMGEQPDLAGTALDLVGIDMGAVRQWRQGAATLDDISIASILLIERLEILTDLGNRRHDATYISLRTALAKKVRRPDSPAKMPVNPASRPPGGPRALPGAAAAVPARASPGPCRPGSSCLPIPAWRRLFRPMRIS